MLALKPSSLTHDQQSFSVSTITAVYPVRTLGEVLPFQQFDTVAISQNGNTILSGLVSSIEKAYSGSSRAWKIVFSDPWYWMENCFALDNDWKPVFSMWNKVSGGGGIIPKISLSAALSRVLNLAKHHPADYELRISDDKMLIPWNAYCDTIGSLLQSIRRWSPRMVSYYDYSGARPKLIITDYDALTPISLPLQPSVEIKAMDVSLVPRGDLVPPCVAIVAETTGSNGYLVSYLSKYPEDGDPTLPHSIVYRTSVDFYYSKYSSTGSPVEDPQPVQGTRAGSLSYQRMKLRGRKINQNDMIKSFWERHFPWMKDVGAIAVYDKTPTITGKPWDGAEENPKGYNTSATGYELTDGQIHTKSIRPQWCNATVKQRLAIPESAAAKWKEKFKNVGTLGGVPCFWEEFSVDLVTMDRPNASYPIDGIYNGEQPSNGPEEGESPQPSEGVPYGDIAKMVWESMQELPYDGTISFVALGEAQTRQYMGRRVSLLGGNPEWQNINTMIQTVSRDLQTNVISLSYGAPEQLGIEEWVELKRVNATSRRSSTLENMQGAPESTEYGFDPKPESPTISQHITKSTGESTPAPEYGFQVRLQKDTEGAITGAQMKPGALYLNGSLLGKYPQGGGSGSSWVTIPQTSGEVWLNVHFDYDGNLTGVEVSGIPGTVYPIKLVPCIEQGRDGADYTFQIADIEDDQVTQYALGMIQIPVFGGTFYPYGPY